MKEINLTSLCETWYNMKNRRNGGLEFPNLKNIKLRLIEGPTWTGRTGPAGPQGLVRHFNVSNYTDSYVHGGMEQTVYNERFYKVNLLAGIIKGYHGKLDLPLPAQFESTLGHSIPVHPREGLTEFRQPVTTTVTGQVFAPPQQCLATSNVVDKMAELLGSFQCTMDLKGIVLFREGNGDTYQQNIGAIIRNLQEQPWNCINYPELSSLRVQGDSVQFTMEGECHIQWDYQKDLQVQQA